LEEIFYESLEKDFHTDAQDGSVEQVRLEASFLIFEGFQAVGFSVQLYGCKRLLYFTCDIECTGEKRN
jgi:hypothetical protein